MSKVVYPSVNNQTTAVNTLREWTVAGCAESGAYTDSVSAPVLIDRETRTAEGWTTPNWRKIRNSGSILPMTPWVQTELRERVNPGTREWCTASNRKGKYINNGWYPGGGLVWVGKTIYHYTDLVDPYDLQYFVQKAAAGIYSSGWDAATFLAEIGQLRRMLTGVGRKLDDLSRGQSPGKLLDLWLEGRYGWRTLLYDIQDLAEVLSRANERRSRYRETKGFTDSGFYSDSVNTGTNPTINISNSISWTINMRGTVVADIDVPDFQFNPITTAWEVTRLSFVVDWLLNVGQALEAASFLLMAKSHKACGGVKIDFVLEGNTSLVTKGTLTSCTSTGTWEGTGSYVERVPMSVSALPRIKLRLNEYKIIDLIALIAQRLR